MNYKIATQKVRVCAPGISLVLLLLNPACKGASPSITVQRQGTNFVVNFTGRLQASLAVEGPYTNVLGATTPHISSPLAVPQQFWRARHLSATSIAAGATHSVALKRDGSLWHWGFEISTMPRRFGTNTDWVTVAAHVGSSGAIKRDRTLWEWHRSARTPTQVGGNNDWVVVALGATHAAAIKADGSLWTWGSNGGGELGNGTYDPANEPMRIGAKNDWATVTCGYYITLAVKSDGTLWAWGSGSSGELGLGTILQTNRPAQVGRAAHWAAVACGFKAEQFIWRSGYTIALATNGTLWGWGDNRWGQLGIGMSQGTNQPALIGSHSDWIAVACGTAHTVALKKDATIWSWGLNDFGQLGTGNEETQSRPVQVGADSDWTEIACASDHTLGLKSDGTLWGWGSRDSGLSSRTNRPTRIGAESNWGR